MSIVREHTTRLLDNSRYAKETTRRDQQKKRDAAQRFSSGFGNVALQFEARSSAQAAAFLLKNPAWK
jgi:hypothetical protein